jgi:BolA protein
MSGQDRLARMRDKLAALSPLELAIEDESAQHAGHAGARGGGGHFRLAIVSDAFAGRSTVMRHRMIYEALGEMMRDEIHALSIMARTSDELSSDEL